MPERVLEPGGIQCQPSPFKRNSQIFRIFWPGQVVTGCRLPGPPVPVRSGRSSPVIVLLGPGKEVFSFTMQKVFSMSLQKVFSMSLQKVSSMSLQKVSSMSLQAVYLAGRLPCLA